MKPIRLTLTISLGLLASWFLLLGRTSAPATAHSLSAPPAQLTASTTFTQAVPDPNEVTGAVYDDATGQLLLVGRYDPARPPLSLDDFAIALRLIYQGEAPAVSIDPIPNNNTTMQVAYFGGITGSPIGWTLFEADRLLKVYSLGRDNLTNQPITSTVSGYKNLFQLTQPGPANTDDAVWFRMWFEPLLTPQTQVKRSANRRAIVFDQAQLTVNTKYINNQNNPNNPNASDPAAEAFVKHFNDHFSDFARERPVLYRLAAIQRFLLIARWLRDEGLPINLSWLTGAYPADVSPTPTTTARILVSQTITPYVYVLEGGVDLTRENQYTDNDPTATALQTAAIPYFAINTIQIIALPFSGAHWDRATAFPIASDYTLSLIGPNGSTQIYNAPKRQLLSYRFDPPCAAQNIIDPICASFIANVDQYNGNRPQLITFADHRTADFGYNAQNELAEFRLDRYDSTIIALLKGIASVPRQPNSPWAELFQRANLPLPTHHLRNRLGVQVFELSNLPPIHPFLQDGKLTFLRGFEQETFPDITVVGLINLLKNSSAKDSPQLLRVMNFLIPTNQATVVFIKGLPTSQQPPALDELFYYLALRSRQYGVRHPIIDDDPQLALANLESRRPLINPQGNWDLALIIDGPAFAPTETVQINNLRTLFTANQVPICSDWSPANCPYSNLIYLTNRPAAELLPPTTSTDPTSLPAAALAGHLQGRSLALFVANHAEDRLVLKELISPQQAIVVTTFNDNIPLADFHTILRTIIEQTRAEPQPSPLNAAIDNSCSLLIVQSAAIQNVCQPLSIASR